MVLHRGQAQFLTPPTNTTTGSSPSSFTGDAACVPDVPGVVTSIGAGAGVGTSVGVGGGGIVILHTLLSNWGKSPAPTLATASSNSHHPSGHHLVALSYSS